MGLLNKRELCAALSRLEIKSMQVPGSKLQRSTGRVPSTAGTPSLQSTGILDLDLWKVSWGCFHKSKAASQDPRKRRERASFHILGVSIGVHAVLGSKTTTAAYLPWISHSRQCSEKAGNSRINIFGCMG